MSISEEDIAFAHELYAGVGKITHRKMMGGLSIYADGQIFAIINAEGRYYLKASGDFAEALAAEGSEKFRTEDGREMNYWTLPDDALDDPDLASDWGRRALRAL